MIAIKTEGTAVISICYRAERLSDFTGWIPIFEASMDDEGNEVVHETPIPEPDDRPGFIAELHYTDASGFWYEYLPAPPPEVEPNEPPVAELDYNTEVQRLIAERYSLQDEIAILRQKEGKTAEWQEYYEYCEQCKAWARELCGLI